MSTRARKARKRAAIPHEKPRKRPTRPYGEPRGLGLVKPQEILAALVVCGRLW